MRRKNILVVLLLVSVVLILSACNFDEPITSESTGFWSKFFVYPMSLFITFFAELFNDSYGLSIIVVTLIVRLVLVPLYVKQLKSSAAMQRIQPEIKKLQEKYSSKDAATQQKLQQETMALFQKYGVNPLAGCFPALIQMPILIAMYQAIMRMEAMDGELFLWFALDSPDYILPLIAGVATFIQQKIMMASNATAGQNPAMAAMLYIMPIMITIFGFILPAALTLYWVIGNVFLVVQTLLLRKPLMENPNTGGEDS